jgi:hypothetical protein
VVENVTDAAVFEEIELVYGATTLRDYGNILTRFLVFEDKFRKLAKGGSGEGEHEVSIAKGEGVVEAMPHRAFGY